MAAAFIPLATSAIGAIAGANKSATPAGPSNAEQQSNFGFDSSGFTVSTGSSKASGAQIGGTMIPWLLIAGAAVVVVLLWKRL